MCLLDEAAYFALEPGEEGELEYHTVTGPVAVGVVDALTLASRIDLS